MFGVYKVPVKLEADDISLSIERTDAGLSYKRRCLDDDLDQIVLTKANEVLLVPVEPVNKPNTLTKYLAIEFDKPVVVGPKVSEKIYLTFPVEIGVFLHEGKVYKNIDIMTLARQKLTFYGDGKTGHICKYWKSRVHDSCPEVNPLREGVLELNIVDNSTNWEKLSQVVFNAYNMKVFFNDKCVAMKAKMELKGEHLAETSFLDSPLEKGMQRAVDLYTPKKMVLTHTKFVMEGGL